MNKTIKYKKHKSYKNKKHKTYHLKLQKKIYSGGEDDLICGKTQIFINDILDYQTALGLPLPINIEELKKRYRKLSLIFHPDKCKDNKASKIFIKIQERYDNLITELSSQKPITIANEMSKWYDEEFTRQSPKKETNSDVSLKPSPNILDTDIIRSLINDFKEQRNKLQNINNIHDITIDNKLNLIKKSISVFSNLSLLNINSLINEISLLIEEINTIDTALTLLQNKFNTYKIPKLVTEDEQWLNVQLNGYHPEWSSSWKQLVVELKKKANKLNDKLYKKLKKSELRQSRRAAIKKLPNTLKQSTRRIFS